MFSGRSIHSIDSKGRIVLPAEFRAELGKSFFVTKGFANNCVQAMSSECYRNISDKILDLPGDKAMLLEYEFTGTAKEVTPNAQGRVLIPQPLREFAELEDEALVIGVNNRVEIWNKDRFEEFMASRRDILAEAVALLNLRG